LRKRESKAARTHVPNVSQATSALAVIALEFVITIASSRENLKAACLYGIGLNIYENFVVYKFSTVYH